MGAWTDIRFPTYQEAAMNCTEEFIAKMKQKDIVINFVQAWRNDTLEEAPSTRPASWTTRCAI